MLFFVCGFFFSIFKIQILTKYFQEHHQSAGVFDPDEARQKVGPDLNLKCLLRQRTSDALLDSSRPFHKSSICWIDTCNSFIIFVE